MNENKTVENEVEPMDARDAQIQELEQRVADLEAEKAQLHNDSLRTLADAQNVLRRTREQHSEALKFATQPLVESLLPVLDNFERTLASLDAGASVDKILEGVNAIERLLKQALSSQGIARIEAVGAAFDPERHEAIAVVIDAEKEEGTIVSEAAAGYTMNGRVIRPSRVQVTKKP